MPRLHAPRSPFARSALTVTLAFVAAAIVACQPVVGTAAETTATAAGAAAAPMHDDRAGA